MILHYQQMNLFQDVDIDPAEILTTYSYVFS